MKLRAILIGGIGLHFLLAGNGSLVAAQPGETLVLALEGDLAPDGNGFLGPLSIFDLSEGAAAFSVHTTGSARGLADDFLLASTTAHGTNIIFREGQNAPDNGKFAGALGQIDVNRHGTVAFYGYLAGTSQGDLNNEGIFRGGSSGLTQIVRENQAAPGGVGVFNSYGVPTINANGTVAFWGAIRDAGTPLISSHGIFLGNGGTLTKVARTYEAAPEGNGTFSGISSSPVISDAGKVAFRADLSGTQLGNLDNSGIYVGSGSGVTLVARENQLSPDGNGRLENINFPFLNDNEKVAFYTTLRETTRGTLNNTAIFAGNGGALVKIARTGDVAPGAGGEFLWFSNSLSINSAGKVAFTSAIRLDTGGTRHGIYLGDGNQLTKIALSGEALPEGNGTFTDFLLASVNNSSTVAFQADISVGGRGIYLSDGREKLLVARTGDLLKGSTITQLGFDPNTFNDFKELAFQATLQDGRMGAFLFTPKLRWREHGQGNWEDNNNWTVSLRPADYTHVVIDPAAGGIMTGPSEDSQILSMEVGGTTQSTAELKLLIDGSLTCSGGATIKKNGRLSGVGEIICDLRNEAVVAPGNSPGRLTIDGDFTQTGTGLLQMELSGEELTEYDQLVITGVARISGMIDLLMLGGFEPGLGARFDLITAGDLVDEGVVVNAPELESGLYFESNVVSEGGNDVYRMTVVPEPGAAVLLVAGAGCLGFFRRKRPEARVKADRETSDQE